MAEVNKILNYFELSQRFEAGIRYDLTEKQILKALAQENLREYPITCPEWIKILANGDLGLWPSVLDEARIEYELMQREARRAFEAEQEKE